MKYDIRMPKKHTHYTTAEESILNLLYKHSTFTQLKSTYSVLQGVFNFVGVGFND